MIRLASLAAAASFAALLAVPARAAEGARPKEPGVWWDVTTEMTIRGPNVPPQAQKQTQTSRECLPKKIPDRPPAHEDGCAFSDYRRSGPRVTFKMSCPQGVTGQADLLWTADTYSGTTVMRGQGMENRITMKGKKVGGDCDANERPREEEPAREAGGDPQEPAQEAPRGR